MDLVEFNALLQKYPNAIGFSEFKKIAWGRLTADQFDQLLAKVKGAGKAEVTRLRNAGWDPSGFTSEDKGIFHIDIFNKIGRQFEQNDPEVYYKYFYMEAAVSANWDAIAAVYNRLFIKDPNAAGLCRLRPELDYTKRKDPDGTVYTFVGGGAAADTWREALIDLMKLGFEGVSKSPALAMDASLAGAMLENKFVEQIAGQLDGLLGTHEIRAFWRCDSRSKANFLDTRTAEASVDLQDRATELNLSQSWNPYSADKIKNVMWLRKSQKDNDYYTIVSVGTDFRTCTAFPTLDEPKNPDYKFPMKGSDEVKPLEEWTDGELATHRKNLALISVLDNGKLVEKIRICTKTYGYMSVVHNGFVINTQAYGGGKFPERAIRGLAVDSVVAYLPFLRVHHGGARPAGFTIFPAPGDFPQLLVDERTLRHRYGMMAGDIVNRAYFDARTDILSRLKSAWHADGYADPNVTLAVQSIKQRPLAATVKAGDDRLK